jgi:hypothetical protein
MKAEFTIIEDLKDEESSRNILTLVLSECTSSEESLIKTKLFDGYSVPKVLKGKFDLQSNSFSLCLGKDIKTIQEYYAEPNKKEEF